MVERSYEPGKQVPSGGSSPEPTRTAATLRDADAATHGRNAASGPTEPVAIIGMSGRFPGADDIETLWQALLDGRDLVTEIPESRWSAPELAADGACRWGGFLENAEGFDPHFFGLSQREADHIDPQQRLFLMEAWKALENAGHAGPCADGARIGTFVGCAEGDYGTLLHDRGALINPYAFMGNACAILASRIAYHLNLNGPALAVDTACSASLVSVHLACEALRAGECDMALAGGVYVMSTPRLHRLATSAAMLSPTGRCHAFGAQADGFVPSEAVAALLLKPLDAALADGDRVIAVIEASGLNQDGRSNGITAPSAPSQAALLKRIYARAGIDPRSIGLIEAHGTGTKLGDPIEFQALTEAFGNQPAGHCALGSIKSNIGHAQLAAGIAGLVKLILSVERATIPPTLHTETVNPHLDLEASPFRLPKSAEDWTGDVRRGAVSAFGFAGTNAHMVVRSHDAPARSAQASPTLMLLSGADEVELKDNAARLVTALKGGTHDLADVALTLIAGRAHPACRKAMVADTLAGFIAALETIAAGQAPRAARADLIAIVPALIGRLPEHAADAGEGTRKALDVLAQAYEAGAPVTPKWLRTLMDRPARRVALPGTQFRLRRCWIDAPETPSANVASTVLEIAADDPLPEAHRVGPRAVVPGTALLLAALGGASALTDIRFSAMAERGAPGPLRLKATTKDGAVTLTGDDGTTLLTANRADAVTPDRPEPDFPPFDAAASDRADALPGRFKAAGLDYGPRLRGIKQIMASGDRVRAEIACAEGRERFGVAGVSAELLDIACQCVAALLPDDAPLPLMVPASLNGFALLRPLKNAAEVRLTHTGGSPDGGPMTVDITLLDSGGAPAALLRGLTLRPPRDSAKDAAKGVTLLLTPRWIDPEPLQPSSGAAARHLTIPASGGDPVQAAKGMLAPALAFCRDAELKMGRPLRLICHCAPDDLAPIAAFWRSVTREYPSLAVACVSLDRMDMAQAEALVPDAGVAVATLTPQGARRRVLREQAPATPFDFRTLVPGAIAITGGGAIGGMLAGYLAERTGMTVGVIGRSQPDGQHTPHGSGTVLRLAADVTNEAALASALDRLRGNGPIRLVIHTAGIAGDAPLADLTGPDGMALLDKVLAPKLAGCALVDRLTRADPLKAFVAFGGLVAHTGNAGQAAYATANALLERWADHREGKTRVIAWPLWAEGGMAIPDRMREALERATGLMPMPDAAGIDALAGALGGGETTLVVAHGDRARLLDALCPPPPRKPRQAPETRTSPACAKSSRPRCSTSSDNR
ncbi:beta-ketoacyl synthase N-terminal-like domain-containing protein [Breoghania sp. L-A4]|uniref:beta-ketoacyl synthase N-terminal-like domain-containing protein n=1 Tax=Breoghania sp. L-A4 TaxID=2304600 RepID=UPI000E35C114|nr:beta-ketoacyl synthase N-terminal-like domain-containing protein [Breoghania sp. L-A4]AXS40802.1 KR domain-containing protein [Breoghania sp. L-A4]